MRYGEELVTNRFSCGKVALDRFLKNNAKKSAKRQEHAIYAACLGASMNCIGYYALQVGSDVVPDNPREKSTYLKSYTAFPAIHLSYLAVHEKYRRRGLGTYLLMNAMEKVAAISDMAGLYAMTLQSLDQDSTNFYASIGFVEYSSGSGQPKMLYPIGNIRDLVGHI